MGGCLWYQVTYDIGVDDYLFDGVCATGDEEVKAVLEIVVKVCEWVWWLALG